MRLPPTRRGFSRRPRTALRAVESTSAGGRAARELRASRSGNARPSRQPRRRLPDARVRLFQRGIETGHAGVSGGRCADAQPDAQGLAELAEG